MNGKKFDRIESPLSAQVSAEDTKKTDDLMQDLIPVFRKYGIESFLVVACEKKPVGPNLLMGALNADSVLTAASLLLRAQKTVQEFCTYHPLL